MNPVSASSNLDNHPFLNKFYESLFESFSTFLLFTKPSRKLPSSHGTIRLPFHKFYYIVWVWKLHSSKHQLPNSKSETNSKSQILNSKEKKVINLIVWSLEFRIWNLYFHYSTSCFNCLVISSNIAFSGDLFS